MNKLFTLLVLIFLVKINAQSYSGEVFLRDNSVLYLNQVYVTNLTTQNTVLSDFNGDFTISANSGDVIRFTSIVTERKDVKLTPQMIGQRNLIELKMYFFALFLIIFSSIGVIYYLRLIKMMYASVQNKFLFLVDLGELKTLFLVFLVFLNIFFFCYPSYLLILIHNILLFVFI